MNRNRIKHLTVLLSFSLLLAAMMQACASADTLIADDTSGTESLSETSADTAATPSENVENSLDARKNVKDTLPDDLDFGGKEFRMVVQKFRMNTDAWVSEENGDLINDAVYNRNRAVEERLNCVITEPYVNDDYTIIAQSVIKSVKSGDDSYDLYMGHAIQMAGDAQQGVFTNWYDVPNINFDMPWYPQIVVDRITVDGKMLIAVSDIALSTVSNTWCMFYNKSLAEQYALPDLYALVDDGEWTIDKLTEITKDIYTDVNGDGKKDAKDFFGFESDMSSSMVTYWWAFDQSVVEVEDDEINLTFGCEKSASILEKLIDVFHNHNGIMGFKDFDTPANNFGSENCIFVNNTLDCADGIYRAMDDFGIIPFPKWDTAQQTYYTLPGGSYSALAIPQTALNNLDFVGAVVEALSSESWKSVIPTYYSIVLKDKQLRDEDSIRMLDYILDGRNIDFGYMYDGWKGYAYKTIELVQNKKNMASFFASSEGSMKKYYESVLKIYQNYES